ncbi:MAG: hypothetical protein KGL95_04395 [Patescibacteria group bacterium]|nr:hypothetical protein [Patescibacteria group bacterium]
MIKCTIEGCEKPIRIKKLGLCQMHETRSRNHGDPTYERKITSPTQCKIENCDGIVYNKNNQLCMKHYQCLRTHGDVNYKSQRKSLVPLQIPNGELIWNYKKAKQLTYIVSEIEKMVKCGYIYDSTSFNYKIYDVIGDDRYIQWLRNNAILILRNTPWFSTYLSQGEEISSLVDEIMKNGKAADKPCLGWINLSNFGVKNEKKDCYFIDSDDDIVKKYYELNIDDTVETDYQICSKLKIHYKRYKKLKDDGVL